MATSSRQQHLLPLRSRLAMLVLPALTLACSPEAASSAADPSTKAPISTSAPAAPGNSPTLQVPMEPFVLAYVQTARQGNHPIDGNLRLPAVWLFGPDGRMVQQITDLGELKRLPEGLNALPAPQDAAMPFGQIAQVLEGQFNATLPSAPNKDAWTALLLLSDQGCENTCPQFLENVLRIRQTAPDRVHSVIVTLKR